MDDRGPTTGVRRKTIGRRRRRHAAARSRVLAGALSAVAFLGLGARMAVHGAPANDATSTSSTSTADGSSVSDTSSADDVDTGSSWSATPGSTSSTTPDTTSHGS